MVGMYIVPRGMEEIIDYIKERYHNKPIFVLENGELEFTFLFLCDLAFVSKIYLPFVCRVCSTTTGSTSARLVG